VPQLLLIRRCDVFEGRALVPRFDVGARLGFVELNAVRDHHLFVVTVAPYNGPATRVLDGGVRLDFGCSFRVFFRRKSDVF
jgi:hypothetical protein